MFEWRWFVGLGLALAAVFGATNPASAGVLDASWTAPATRSDGSPLTDLGSYRVYYSTSATPCPGVPFFTVASSTETPPANQTVNFRLTGLTTGSTYNVSVTAVDTSGNESACSSVASAVAQVDIAVTPAGTTSFGNINIGSFATQTFTVQSTRSGTITGTASVPAPFTIVSGSPFTLVGTGATATVTVRFTPISAVLSSTNVSFSADGDTLTRLVTGTGVTTGPTLTVSKAGAGSGTVTSSPAGISCGATCSTAFTTGTVVTLTAAPAAGATFTGWSGGGSTGAATCAATSTAAAGVGASTGPTLTVSKAGAGSGTVTSTPAGISCGATCSTAFTTGTVVTLTAAPAAGATFTGWSGSCTGTGTCSVTMSAARAVMATFAISSSSSGSFTYRPLVTQSTVVKAVHITELRKAINAARRRNGLAASTWTDATLTAGSTTLKAVHITELRTALNAVYTRLGRALPAYTDPTLG